MNTLPTEGFTMVLLLTIAGQVLAVTLVTNILRNFISTPAKYLAIAASAVVVLGVWILRGSYTPETFFVEFINIFVVYSLATGANAMTSTKPTPEYRLATDDHPPLYDGSAWWKMSLVSPTEGVETLSTRSGPGKNQLRVTATTANIRNEASAKAGLVAQVKRGSILHLDHSEPYDEVEGFLWYRIVFARGYVREDLVEVIE